MVLAPLVCSLMKDVHQVVAQIEHVLRGLRAAHAFAAVRVFDFARELCTVWIRHPPGVCHELLGDDINTAVAIELF